MQPMKDQEDKQIKTPPAQTAPTLMSSTGAESENNEEGSSPTTSALTSESGGEPGLTGTLILSWFRQLNCS